MIGRRHQAQAELLEALLQSQAARGVPGPGVVEALVEQRAQPGVQGEDHRHRGGVVIRPTRLSPSTYRAISPRSKYHEGGRSRRRPRARSPTVSGARPGGTPRHFWVPL